MTHLARIKLPSPIRLAASSRPAKSGLLVLSLLVLAPLAVPEPLQRVYEQVMTTPK
jgi:hypothetical protein